jgi:hypothetical protein
LLCQRPQAVDVQEQPYLVIPAPAPSRTSDADKEADRYAEKYVPLLAEYGSSLANNIRKHFTLPIGQGGHSALTDIAIDKSGKLLWISVDTDSRDYRSALIHAIVLSAPFPPLPKGSPAKTVLRMPFSGPSADALQAVPIEYRTMTNKPDWECDQGLPDKNKLKESLLRH